MSSKPDGTDPRILQPEGETVYMASTVRQSKARKYHRKGCDSLDEIVGEPKQIDIAVAKWKNMKPCSRCLGARDGGRTPTVQGKIVDRFRKALVWTDCSAREVSRGHEFSPRTVSSHAKATREYNYETKPTTPTVTFKNQEWVWNE